MNTISDLLAGVLVCATLAGCASPGGDERSPSLGVLGRPPPVDCGVQGGPKRVNVSVVNFTPNAVRIRLPAEVRITNQKDGLRWVLSGPAARHISFAADGVVFKPNQPGGMASSPATGDSKTFVWCFNATLSDLVWEYGIKIYDQDAPIPAQVWECDPTIRNSDSVVSVGLQYIDCIRSN